MRGLPFLKSYNWAVLNLISSTSSFSLNAIASSICCSFCYIPCAHIQAGERSGNIDNTSRLALARFSHIHFAANQDAYKRLIRSGEEKKRIFNVGAPQLDEIRNGEYLNK